MIWADWQGLLLLLAVPLLYLLYEVLRRGAEAGAERAEPWSGSFDSGRFASPNSTNGESR